MKHFLLVTFVVLALLWPILPVPSSYAATPMWFDGEYLYRYFVWGAQDLVYGSGNYAPFPYHVVESARSAFSFAPGDPTALPTTVEYYEGNTLRRAVLEDLLPSTGTYSFIVIRNGKILCERYFNGHHRDSMCVSKSVAKSFLSALVGIALDEGLIKSIREPITAYLPELRGRGFDSITIRDLLAMGSGIRFRWGQLPWDELQLETLHPDLTRFILSDLTIEEPPGRVFNYADCDTELMGLILKRATGRSLANYLQEKIWKPIGMEYPATWSIDSERDGLELAFVQLNARAIDLAKFGYLYMNNGNWNGTQVVPERWVTESTTQDRSDRRPWKIFADFRKYGGYYKYYWWGHPTDSGGYTFWAQGQDGQYIFVSPRDKIVIVRTGSKWGIDSGGWQQIFRYMAKHMAAE